MIISASRRTDIPAYYADWFFDKIEKGYCETVNPFNPKQIKRVSLKPEDVDAFIFWSRNTKQFRERLPLLNEKGYAYYFLITVVNYGKEIEPNLPALKERITEFQRLSDTLEPRRVIWRYDPIFINTLHTFDYHLSQFSTIAKALSGYTVKVIISFADYYRKVIRNLKNNTGISGIVFEPEYEDGFEEFSKELLRIAETANMEIQSCAEREQIKNYGILTGGCIDANLINNLFGKDIKPRKDTGQRKLCNCHQSIDIGAYNTCLHGCRYCYATNKYEDAKMHFEKHTPAKSSLI